MHFRICNASEVMQKRNESIFGDIPDVHVLADDIIVAASNEKDQGRYYNKGSRTLPESKEGQAVLIRTDPTLSWVKVQ